MNAASSKSLLLLGILLMVALGFQAGAIKMLMSLQQPDTLNSARLAAALEALPDRAATPRELPREPLVETPSAPNTAIETAQNPELAAATAPAAHPEAVTDAEAQALQALAAPAATPAQPAAPNAPAMNTAPAAATPIHNPMLSNIPPPIQLEPEAALLETAPIPPTASAESPLAAAVAALPASPEVPPTASSANSNVNNNLLEPDWLKGRDPKRYTVQMYSGKDMSKLREMATANASVAQPAYFTTTSRSGPWYSLVIGDFADFNSAQAAASKLAGQSGATKPWIRRFSEIQAKMADKR